MLNKQDVNFLSKLSMFAGLREDALTRITTAARRLDFTEDQILFREGEPAKEMAIVLDGRLEVTKRSDAGTEACIAILGPGDVVGEMSLIDIQPRSADVWARAPVSVVVLHHGALGELYREDKQSYTLLVLNIAREISIRLRRLDAVMANVMGHIQAVTGTVSPTRLLEPVTASKAEPPNGHDGVSARPQE